jgi:hypothetical protein
MNPLIKIVDIPSGVELEREMNAEELSQYEASQSAREAEQAAQAEQQALRDSANQKLAALGLTPEEIAAITA